MSKTAILIGATGLVGKEVLMQLLTHPSFQKVIVLHRRSTGVAHHNLEEHIINFDAPEEWAHLVKGDSLFSSLGTTIKQAGSKAMQYKIDFTYQYEVAKAAAENGVKKYILVSSSGANAKSKIFYPRIKGELEEAVQGLNFEQIELIRPSVLLGDRPETRFGEKMAAGMMSVLKYIPGIKKYRSIHGYEVAEAMINASLQNSEQKVHTHELEGVFELLTK